MQYVIAKLGENRKTPRLWLEGSKLVQPGFTPGAPYTISVVAEKKMLVLKLADLGERLVAHRQRNGKVTPIIDIENAELLKMFEGMEAVRVIMSARAIFVLPLATELKKRERVARLKAELESGQPISVGSLATGGGVLDMALRAGLREAGVESKLLFANEIRDELLENAVERNPAWEPETQFLSAPMQELAIDEYAMAKLPKVSILSAGIPCSGASVAGRAKNAISMPEAHPEVGHLVVPFLQLVNAVQPSIIAVENVPPYQSSASAWLLRHTLRDWGYTVHERILDAGDFNELEHRKRLCLIGVTQGVEFDFEQLLMPAKVTRTLAEILEPVADDDESWSEMAGLKAKEIRDIAAGKGFRMQTFGPEDTSIGTLTRGYMKRRSTDPKLRHPSNPDLLRQLSPVEHARCKGIPEQLVEGLSATLAHELLGQSICFKPFVAVFKLVGSYLKRFAQTVSAEVVFDAQTYRAAA